MKKFKTRYKPHYGYECSYCPDQYAYCFDREEGKITKITLPWYALEDDTAREDILHYIHDQFGYQKPDIMLTSNDIGSYDTFRCFDMESGPEE